MSYLCTTFKVESKGNSLKKVSQRNYCITIFIPFGICKSTFYV